MIRHLLVIVLFVSACAPTSRPAVFAEVDRIRATPSAKEASELAPQAFLSAEKTRRDAELAFAAGDRPGSEILAELAVAAYAQADVLARIARAEERRAGATSRTNRAEKELATLEEAQHRVAAEADDLEMRVRVIRDAQPLAGSEPASAEREAARLAAARSIASQARLLCVATKMLAPETKELVAATSGLDSLDTAIAGKPKRAPIDDAIRLRSSCLAELTRARRPAESAAPEAGKPDILLDLLAKANFEPLRDDRGIVVVLRDLFDGNKPKQAAHERLTALAEVARAHPDFPVLVVVHSGHGGSNKTDAARAEAVGKALLDGGAPRVETKTAGDTLPVAPQHPASVDKRNERVEVVFVAPSF